MNVLYKHPKVKSYVSLSNECWGLGIFEAVQSGLPVISLDFGGPLDFLYAKVLRGEKEKTKPLFSRVDYNLRPIPKESEWPGVLTPGSLWAYPTLFSYRKALRDTVKNYQFKKNMAKELREIVLEKTKLEDINKKIVNTILGEQFNDEDDELWKEILNKVVVYD